ETPCDKVCGRVVFTCEVSNPATNEITCHPACTGRRPAGLTVPMRASAANVLGDYFAEMAALEAASVDAFRTLRDELALHRAPRSLRRAAARAARDEVRHARVTASIAKRFGAQPAPVEVIPSAPRPLEAIARENAVEGCVRETFGALIATRQAIAARDP